MRLPPTRIRLPHSELAEYYRLSWANPPIDNPETAFILKALIGKDGTITVMTGKVEGGQGSRAEITQAAAEELRVSTDRVQLLMADTDLVPDDGITAGSRSTPSTVPAVRQACAAARNLLEQFRERKPEADYRDLAADDGQNLLEQVAQ